MWMTSIFLLLFACQVQASDPQNVILILGEKKAIPAEGDLLLGPEGVVKALDQGRTYQLEAVKTGGTEVRTGAHVYRISVLSSSQHETWTTLQKAVQSTLGLKVSVDQGEIWLEGHLTTFQEWQTIADACEPDRCRYKNRMRTQPSLRAKIQARLNEKLRAGGFGLARIQWEPQVTLLVPAAATKSLPSITKAVSAFGVTVAEDPVGLDLAPSVRAQISIIEIRKDEGQKYGLQWPTSYSTQILPKDGEVDKLLLTAQFLETRGIGKILANPSLLCRSGKEAEFLAGGELPIKIINFKMQDVIWKRYGILLKLKPKADFSGRMSLEIETEVSSIDPSHTVDGIPGFFTNRVQTHFDLSEPRTIALSGLVKSEESRASEGILGLSRIPVLGALFSSRDYQNKRTELVILVRPEVVKDEEGVH